MFRLTMLGAVRVTSSDGSAALPGSLQAKRIALLGYLAAARPAGAQRRDTVLGLLWAELDQDRARLALRQALHGIRKSIGAESILSHGTELLELNRAAISCDLWELEAASAAGDSMGVLARYDGELLAGLFLSDAPAFESWIDGERQRVRETVRAAAWQAAEAGHANTPCDTVRAVRVAVSLAGFDESAIRRGMRLLAGAGAGAEALSLYERFAEEARRELEVEPAAETRALAAELRRPAAIVECAAAGPREEVAAEMTRTPPRAPNLPLQSSTSGLPMSVTPATPSLGGSTAPIGHRTAPAWLTRTRRASIVTTTAIVAVLAAARLAPSADARLDPRRVEVAEFTGDGGLADSVARHVTIDARAALSKVDGAVVTADSGSARRIAGGMATRVTTPGTIVRGTVRREGDSLQVRAEIVDAGTNAIVRTVVARLRAGSASGPAIDAFNDRLTAALSTALYPGWGSALSQPPSYSGYRLFVEGMRRIKAEDHRAAISLFRRAYDEDSSFTAAGLLAAMELYQVGGFVAADSIARAISARRESLPPVDERLLEWITLSLRGDRIGARAAMQGVVALAPHADLAWLQLAIDNLETARPGEAIAALERIAPEAEFGESWVSYWATRIEALHLLGDHHRELAVAREGLRRHPELGVLANYELRALAALGRTAEIARIVETSASRTSDPAMTMRQTARELTAHGHADAAQALLRRVRAHYATRTDSARQTVVYRSGLARTLYVLGEREPATAIYDSLLRERPGCLVCVGALGVLAARRGDRSSAIAYERMLAASSRPFMFGSPLFLQARIASSLGERARATTLLTEAFAAGLEFDVMTHADADLAPIRPDSIYRAFSRAR